jgi:hypothetical protein
MPEEVSDFTSSIEDIQGQAGLHCPRDARLAGRNLSGCQYGDEARQVSEEGDAIISDGGEITAATPKAKSSRW